MADKVGGCSGQRALQVAQDICNLAAAYRFIWQDRIFSIGASIGLTTINRQVRNVAEILGAGDTACYAAKEGFLVTALEKITDMARCNQLFPAYTHPRVAAGGPRASDIFKCQLKPVAASDYKTAPTAAQLQALQAGKEQATGRVDRLKRECKAIGEALHAVSPIAADLYAASMKERMADVARRVGVLLG